MKINKIIIMMFSLSFSIFAQAEENSVAYHCPTIKEIKMMQNIRTSINDKDVSWKMISNNNLMLHDHPTEFVKAILERNDSNSYDMTVSCIYRTEKNKEFIISPLASWYWHVDGIAEKTLGNDWHTASNASNLECNKSIIGCGFLFR